MKQPEKDVQLYRVICSIDDHLSESMDIVLDNMVKEACSLIREIMIDNRKED